MRVGSHGSCWWCGRLFCHPALAAGPGVSRLLYVDALTLVTPECSRFRRVRASLATWWPGTASVGVVMNVYMYVLVAMPCSRHRRCS